MESNGFEQLITKPTRIANTSETLLDHFIIKVLKVKSAQVRNNMSFSDLSLITLEFYTSQLEDEDTKTYRDTSFLKSILNQQISKTMQTINFSESLDDCFHQFASKYNRVLDNFAPFRSSSSKKRKAKFSWITI